MIVISLCLPAPSSHNGETELLIVNLEHDGGADVHTKLSIRENMDFSLYHVEKAAYDSFHLEMVKPYWIVSFVLDGEVESRSCGVADMAKTGDVMIHPPNLPFTEIAVGPGVHLWMLIDVRVIPQLSFFQRFPVSRVITLLHADSYAAAFEVLLHLWNEPPSPLRDYKGISVAIQLLGDILESWMVSGSPSRPASKLSAEDRFLQVVKHMEDNLDKKLMREDLAQLMHLHPGYFNRVFKQTYGVSSVQMLKMLRLRKAMQLLEEPDNTLERIAAVCGFGDAAYFSKIFKESVGKTPGDYRKSIKSTKEGFVST